MMNNDYINAENSGKEFLNDEKIVSLIIQGYSENELKERGVIREYYTTSDSWFKNCNSKAALVPVYCYLYKFARRFKTREAKDILYLTESGKTVPSQNYDDYVNTVFLHVYSIVLKLQKFPNLYRGVKFKNVLFLATRDGIKECWASYHNRQTKTVIDEATGKKKRVYMVAEHDDIADYTERLTIDDYAGTERQAIENALIDDLFETAKPRTAKYMKLYAQGYTFDDIARTQHLTGDAIAKLLKRHGRTFRERERIQAVHNSLEKYRSTYDTAKEKPDYTFPYPMPKKAYDSRTVDTLYNRDAKEREKRISEYFSANAETA